MLYQNLENYIKKGYDVDVILPFLIQEDFLTLENKLTNYHNKNLKTFNILLEDIIVNVWVNEDKIYTKNNYLSLVKKHLKFIKFYQNELIIKDKKNQIINKVCDNFYTNKQLDELTIVAEYNGLKFYQKEGLGLDFKFFNKNIAIILQTQNVNFDADLVDNNSNFIDFQPSLIKLRANYFWSYQGYYSYEPNTSFHIDQNFKVNASEEIDLQEFIFDEKDMDQIEYLSEENAQKLDFEEIKF